MKTFTVVSICTLVLLAISTQASEMSTTRSSDRRSGAFGGTVPAITSQYFGPSNQAQTRKFYGEFFDLYSRFKNKPEL
jgi:hypothetical protein